MVDELDTYKYYIALKTHFSQVRYNAIKSNFAVKASYESLLKRNDAYRFTKIANLFASKEDCIAYFASNFAYNNQTCLYNIIEGKKIYKRWCLYRKNPSNSFMNDLSTVLTHSISEKEILGTTEAKLPLLLELALHDKIHLETLSLFNEKYDILGNLKKNKLLYSVWKDDLLRISKIKGFIIYNDAEITSIFNAFMQKIN